MSRKWIGQSRWRGLCLLLVCIVVADAAAAGVSYLVHKDDPPRMPEFAVSELQPSTSYVDAYHPLSAAYGYTTESRGPISTTAAGKVIFTLDGEQYIHPDLNAAYAVAALDSYRRTDDRAWLKRAETAASDVLATAADRMFPHTFPGSNSYGEEIAPPWYSAHTQGLMLSVLVRLHQLTGERRWRLAADQVYGTFLRFHDFASDDGTLHSAWITTVDERGYLWFVKDPGSGRDSFVVSAQLTAIIGIYDYLTLEPLTPPTRQGALRLFDGAATTVAHYLPDIRKPGDVSRQTVGADSEDVQAHFMVIRQLATLGQITGADKFRTFASLLRRDTAVPAFEELEIDLTRLPDLDIPARAFGRISLPPTPDRKRGSSSPILHPDRRFLQALAALDRYVQTRDRRWLAYASSSVERVMKMSEGGLIPHRDRAQNVYSENLPATWYSARTQGLALAALSRLNQVTHRALWRQQADEVFATLSRFRGFPMVDGHVPDPWFSLVVDLGYLWFEQFPQSSQPSYVVSAHVTTLFGLYEYWRVSDSALAGRFLRGASATVSHYLPEIRRPGQISRSNMADEAADLTAHKLFVRQLMILGTLTRRPEYGRYATRLGRDA